MKVATRITVATAVVVAIAAAGYAYYDFRATREERLADAEREAAAVAAALRLGLETSGPALHVPTTERLEALGRQTGWEVTVVPRTRANEPVKLGLSARQLQQLNDMIDVTKGYAQVYTGIDGDRFFHAIQLRAVSDREENRIVVGMLEIARPADTLDARSEDISRAIALIALIISVTTIMVGLFASRFVTRPITKLLRGIDDVAKGDLSHVILSEHDDEIGAIATRFNEMTYSLRESRGETLRQNEAKLALEQRLGQTEKLATIGQLAAEIAHEVGTPLNVIAGRSRSIQKKSKDPDVVEKNAEIIAEQTARITRIIQRLLDFTRRKVGHIERADVNINELSLTTMELLAGQFSAARVKVRLDRMDGLPHVAGDADRLQQVLINLVLNAVQAMPDGGQLGVETSLVRRTRPGLEEGGAEQDFVAIAVRDTGIGIPAEIRDKIFDPFYTTKEGQGGTGLGLAVCFGIVKEHDGWIDVEDSAGGGTVFRVFIPS